jgi:PAS domain S-box-containing protein
MSYVTILWAGAGATALVLGLVHGLVWYYDRRARANLAFVFAAIGLAGGALTELGMLHSQTAREWGQWVWWTHVPIFVYVVGTTVFLRMYVGAGRLWLLVLLIASRTLILAANFFSDPAFNFERIDAITQISFLGEPVATVASAVIGRYQWFALVTSVLFPLFILDVIVTLWRRQTREARRVALVVGGPVLVSVLLSVVLTQMVIWRVVQLPMLLIPPFLISLAAMAVELSRDTVRASKLARDLRESEQRLQLAANAAGAGLWQWDAATGRVWATQHVRTILGVPEPSELDPAALFRSVDPDDASQVDASLRKALQSGGECAVQFRIVRPDGGTRWIAAQAHVDVDPHGKPQRVRGVLRDVTQQRLAEDEANELRRKLTHVGRVTMLGQLSSALAHELSQPLSAIQHNAETAQLLLTREKLDMPLLREIVADILRDDRRAAQVVQRLRAWLKQGRLHSESVRLSDVAQDVLALVRAEAAMKHVSLECNVPQSLPPVLGDRIHLSQVLLNLIMNAMDAVGGGSETRRQITIEARRASNHSCEVSVSDSGPGIAPEALEQVFEPFFTSKNEGMGIGLSISRSIIEAHGGKLWAENGPRGGATFRFTVPAQVETLAQQA